MNPTDSRRIVITGGPGSGKTTLIAGLAQLGYAHVPEAGRAIIQHQQQIGGPALPWQDPGPFAEMMLCWEMRSYDLAAGLHGPVFFDRGVPDVIGYLRLTGLSVPPHMDTAAKQFRYHSRVFIAPPWPAIFSQDAERKQDFQESVRTYEAMLATYRDYGYELIALPLGSVPERIRFLHETLGIAPTPAATQCSPTPPRSSV